MFPGATFTKVPLTLTDAPAIEKASYANPANKRLQVRKTPMGG